MKGLERPISLPNFLEKSAAAMCAAAVCDLGSIGIAGQVKGLEIVLFDESKETTMPHVIVKLHPGRSEEQKIQLADAIVKDVVAIAKCGEESVSVAIEEIQPKDWADKVYKPDIIEKQDKLYKKPGYSM